MRSLNIFLKKTREEYNSIIPKAFSGDKACMIKNLNIIICLTYIGLNIINYILYYNPPKNVNEVTK